MTQPVVRGAPAVLGAVACSAAGFFFGTGLSGVPVPALTWLAPLPVLLLAPRVGAPVAVGAAFLASLLGATGSWGFFAGSADVPLPVGIGIDLALSAMFAAAVAVFRMVVTRGRPLLGAAAAAATWTAAAFLVQVVNPQGLMGTFANDQGDVPAVLQVAAFTGGWGVEFLVLFAPAAVAALAVPGVDRAAARRAAVIGIAVPALVVGLGAVRLATADSGSRHQVAAVVDNRAGWGADVSTPAGQQLVADYAAQVAALPPGVRTAVLPEGAFTVTAASLGELIDPLAEVARARGTDVVVGYTRLDGQAKLAMATTVPGDGSAPVDYLKHHDRVSPPGHETPVRLVDGIRTGTAICGDLDFAEPTRAYARLGAGVLTVPASDNGGNGYVHSRLAAVRAAEYGTAVVWAAREGDPAVIDGYGRVLAATSTAAPERFSTLVVDLAAGPAPTWYAVLGDWFAWLCLAFLALLGIVRAASGGRTPAAAAG